jgi:hypothetical protein
MSKFLADATTIKFLVIFLISELMFFGPKKEIMPWREVLFDRGAPGLKGVTRKFMFLYDQESHLIHILWL